MSIKEQLRQIKPEDGTNDTGQNTPRRNAPDTRHMIILKIINDFAGHTAGGRVRLFLTDEGYSDVIDADGRGDVKIIRHARVRMGDIVYDAQERGDGRR